MPDRISTLDAGYQPGDLSVYPDAIDNRETLYEARNNAETKLKQTLTYNGRNAIVLDASGFPNQGLLRIGPPPGTAGNYELIYYGTKTASTFGSLVRGFAGSIQTQWPTNSWVTNSVMAEHHNAIKDAILKIEDDLGVETFPRAESLNGILKELETRFLAPKPIFRAFPLRGVPSLRVRFQNYSGGDPIRYLWDFGDGSTSTEVSPIHTYIREGIYTVKLNVITSLGGQGIATKSNYITVSNDEGITFFYSNSLAGVSAQTAALNSTTPTTFTLVDQTEGPIVERIWNFDDGTKVTIDDGDIHSVDHVYDKPGEYVPTLLTIFDNQRLKRIDLADTIRVS
jgi:PKD repeat protein